MSENVENNEALKNRAKNLVKTPARLVKSITHFGADILDSLNWAIDDVWWVFRSTKKKVKSIEKWDTRYKKTLNVPIKWWIWAVSIPEIVTKPVWGFVSNVATSVKKLFKNLKSTACNVFSKNTDFSYSDLKFTQERLEEGHRLNPKTPWTRNWWKWSKSKEKSSKSQARKNLQSNERETNMVSATNNTHWTSKADPLRWRAKLWKAPENTSTKPQWKNTRETIKTNIHPDINSISDVIPFLWNRWKTMLNYLAKKHPEINIVFHKNNDDWHLYWPKGDKFNNNKNTITVWTKNFRDVLQTLYHEIAHICVFHHIPGTDELFDYIKFLFIKYDKHLFSVSNNRKDYETFEKQTIEGVCEAIALYTRWDFWFHKYMKDLQEWKNKSLAKISKPEADHLKKLCENIFSKLDTNIVKLNENKENLRMAA